MKEKECKLCGKLFTPTGRGSKYCGGTGAYYIKGTCSYDARMLRMKEKNRYGWCGTKIRMEYIRAYGEIKTPCEHCGTLENLSLDHIKPQMIGGGHEKENLRVLCRSCNTKRHHTLKRNALKYYFKSGFID